MVLGSYRPAGQLKAEQNFCKIMYYKVYDFMLELFPNKFAMSNVFAYLYGIKTWRGSTRKLADCFRMPESSLRAIMSSLIDEGYIRKTAEGYQCVYAAQESAQKSAHESEGAAQGLTADAQKCAVAAPLSPTPPITNKIKKEKENINARENIAPQNSSPLSSFDLLVEAYRQRSGESQLSQSELNESRNAWERCESITQELLIAELKNPNGWCGKRLLWTINDFQPPKPLNYNGHPDAERLMNEGKLCSARPQGESAYGTYLHEDAVKWKMEILRIL